MHSIYKPVKFYPWIKLDHWKTKVKSEDKGECVLQILGQCPHWKKKAFLPGRPYTKPEYMIWGEWKWGLDFSISTHPPWAMLPVQCIHNNCPGQPWLARLEDITYSSLRKSCHWIHASTLNIYYPTDNSPVIFVKGPMQTNVSQLWISGDQFSLKLFRDPDVGLPSFIWKK